MSESSLVQPCHSRPRTHGGASTTPLLKEGRGGRAAAGLCPPALASCTGLRSCTEASLLSTSATSLVPLVHRETLVDISRT